MSDIATRANERNARVVASTRAPASAERRSKSSVPSQAVTRTRPSAASTGTSRAAAGVVPRPFIAAAISQ